mgnify:CR=1 FL=1
MKDSKYSQMTCKIQQEPEARHPSKKTSANGIQLCDVGDT